VVVLLLARSEDRDDHGGTKVRDAIDFGRVESARVGEKLRAAVTKLITHQEQFNADLLAFIKS
jgi:hypothetical protein